MRVSFAIAGAMACVALWPSVSAMCQAQPAGVHEMVIYNGPVRSVHLIGDKGMPIARRAALLEAERALNEIALQADLATLQRQYVSDETVQEARRRTVQLLLYGYSSATDSWAYWSGANYRWSWAFPFGYSPYRDWGYSLGSRLATQYGLGQGVGDEGRIKAELARPLGTPAASDAAAAARRELDAALGRAGLK